MPEVKENQTAAPAPETAESAANGPATPPKPPVKKPAGKGRQKMVKRLIALGVAAAIFGGGGFALYRFLTDDDSELGEIYAQPAEIGTIQSKVSGRGSARAKESAAITLTQSGVVQEVFVAGGQTVMAGDPLYTIYSEAAETELSKAQEEMDKLLEEANNLTVRAPFAGKLIDVEEFQIDQQVGEGTKVATLVNDKKLKLSLYFSYAYEGEIWAGQSVDVSIPTRAPSPPAWTPPPSSPPPTARRFTPMRTARPSSTRPVTLSPRPPARWRARATCSTTPMSPRGRSCCT